MKYTEEYARELDQQDPLKDYRTKFYIADPTLIYLDGNSLGRLPSGVAGQMMSEINTAWGERLIRSWNEGWYDENARIGDQIALLAGAEKGEVMMSDSTSVNLYKLAHAALKFKKGRTKIITDNLNFPSDVYILQGLVREFGDDYSLQIVESKDGMTVNSTDLEAILDENTALVCLSHVVFKSAFRYPMKEITSLVQDAGAMMLWDLSHSIGAVPGELNTANADLAVGCSYKYLNGGPGAPAFLYVRSDLQEKLESPIWGWFGEKDPFEFLLDYRPAKGIRRFLAGTPPILSMAPLKHSLELLLSAGMNNLRLKSSAQTSYLLKLAQEELFELGFQSGTPADPDKRGSHVTLRHPEAYRICKSMIDPGIGGQVIIPDFREADNIRLGITPLYTSYMDIFKAEKQMKTIVAEKLYEQHSDKRDAVT